LINSKHNLVAESMANCLSAIVNSKSEKLFKNYLTLLTTLIKPTKSLTLNHDIKSQKVETSKRNHSCILDPNEFYKSTIREHLKLVNINSASLVNLSYRLEVNALFDKMI
jgi:deoxycytidine triphosphate deaminase